MNFWQNLKKPIMVLAPMADVTDAAFRRIIAAHGKPDAMFTEFVSADGMFLGGREALMKDLIFSESERPIVAQFFTSRPDMMKKAAELSVELGFDGFDINMGCPDRSIERQGAGAALIKTPELARELIRSAKKGVYDATIKKRGGKSGENLSDDDLIPVSVKTRVGYNTNEIETWLPELLGEKPAVVTIHARTRKQMSKVPADWSIIKRAVEIRDMCQGSTLVHNAQGSTFDRSLIFGNGDVLTVGQAHQKVEETGCDGVMIGKGIFGTPDLFAPEDKKLRTPGSKLGVLVDHTKAFEELLPDKPFHIMKKHFKAYVNGFDGAKELREKLMAVNNATEVEEIIVNYLK